MEKLTSKKNGLVYTDDFKVVVGIDMESDEFTGNVPNGVTVVEEEAFSCCSLKRISLPDSVTYVGANLFCNSTELEFVRLPATLKQLSPFMFCGCKSLAEVEMPLEVEDFSEGLFAECSSLKEIPFRAGIRTLPEGVFDSCTGISSLVIPDSVTKICNGAIVNCTSLETIVLPSELEELEEGWLSDCPNLKHIRISEDNMFYKTNEESNVLYKITDGGDVAVLELKNKSDSSLPGFKEPDDSGSIITFDESEDETMDETILFNGAEENEEEVVTGATEEEALSFEEPEVTPAATESASGGNPDMDARLAEILGQNKMYDDGDFSIMDIPQASDEEIASNALASTAASDEEKFNNAPTVQVTVHEAVEESPDDMEAKLKEIMGQNTDEFSINDIPMASEEELNANKVLETSDAHDSAEIGDSDGLGDDVAMSEAEFGDSVSEDADADEQLPEPQQEINEDKAFMQNLVFETQKVEQQNTGISASENRILFVFAENLVETDLGLKFSKGLQKACDRLAKIHNFTSVYYFSNTRMDNDKFASQLKDFMKDKDVLIACEGDSLYSISDRTEVMAGCLGVELTKESIENEINAAKDPSVKPLKLIVCDNLAE